MTKRMQSIDHDANLFQSTIAKCEVCGKEFFRAPEHLYKYNASIKLANGKTASKVLWFCRYNHYVQWMKDHGKW